MNEPQTAEDRYLRKVWWSSREYLFDGRNHVVDIKVEKWPGSESQFRSGVHGRGMQHLVRMSVLKMADHRFLVQPRVPGTKGVYPVPEVPDTEGRGRQTNWDPNRPVPPGVAPPINVARALSIGRMDLALAMATPHPPLDPAVAGQPYPDGWEPYTTEPIPPRAPLPPPAPYVPEPVTYGNDDFDESLAHPCTCGLGNVGTGHPPDCKVWG